MLLKCKDEVNMSSCTMSIVCIQCCFIRQQGVRVVTFVYFKPLASIRQNGQFESVPIVGISQIHCGATLLVQNVKLYLPTESRKWVIEICNHVINYSAQKLCNYIQLLWFKRSSKQQLVNEECAFRDWTCGYSSI